MAKSRRRRPAQRRPSAGGSKPVASPGQVGKRPSRPGFLMLVGLMWIACGSVALFALKAGWRLVPAIVFIGIGLFYVRAASATIVRRESRKPGS